MVCDSHGSKRESRTHRTDRVSHSPETCMSHKTKLQTPNWGTAFEAKHFVFATNSVPILQFLD